MSDTWRSQADGITLNDCDQVILECSPGGNGTTSKCARYHLSGVEYHAPRCSREAKHFEQSGSNTVRFATGATRSAENLFDPEGFISPVVLASFSRYMMTHRVQKDGKVRASDNWTKGMPTSRAYRSLTRHFLDLWLMKRGYKPESADCQTMEDALHAMFFNIMVILKNRIDNNHHEEGDSESNGSSKGVPVAGLADQAGRV